MAKLRVYQLARELNLDNSEIIRELQHMGVPVTSHSNTVEDRLAEQLRKKLGSLAAKQAAAAVEVVEEPPAIVVEPEPVPPPPVEVEKPEPRVEVKAEPKVEPKPEPKVEPKVEVKVEPKVEEKAPPVEQVRVAQPPVVTPAPQPPAPPAPPPAPPKPLTTPSGGRIIPPPERVGPRIIAPPPPPAPPKPAPTHEERKTMQQIVEERLRQQHRLPPQGPAPRRPMDRPGQPPRPGVPGQQRPPAPGMQGRGAAPAPPGARPQFGRGPLVPPPPQPTEQRRPAQRHEVDRTQRYERQAEKRLESPFVRPQPKVEAPREHRSITLTEGVTIK